MDPTSPEARLGVAGWTKDPMECIQAAELFINTLPNTITGGFTREDLQMVQIPFALWSGQVCSNLLLHGIKSPRWQFPSEFTHAHLDKFLVELCNGWFKTQTPIARWVGAPEHTRVEYGSIGPNSHLASMTRDQRAAFHNLSAEGQHRASMPVHTTRQEGAPTWLALFHSYSGAVDTDWAFPLVHFVDEKMKFVARDNIVIDPDEEHMKKVIADLFVQAVRAERFYVVDLLKSRCIFVARRDLWRASFGWANDEALKTSNRGSRRKAIFWGEAEMLLDHIKEPISALRGCIAMTQAAIVGYEEQQEYYMEWDRD